MNRLMVITIICICIFFPPIIIYGYLSTGFVVNNNHYNRTVILCLDDSSRGQYVNAYPILRSYNYTVTYAIITGYTNLTNDELRELNNYGMDLESHTVNHVNLQYQFNPFIIDYCLREGKIDLSKVGADSNILILPFGVGAYNIVYRLIVSYYYNYSRGSLYNMTMSDKLYNLNNGFERWNIPGVLVGNFTSLSQFKGFINDETLNNKTVILTYHRVEDKSDSYLTVSTNQFNEEMKYLKDNGVNVITLKQYLGGIK